ncbi:MAG: AraC family transcriptional regulator [Bacteroidaceae bacterium]|nr:AraC family transcriptional regulator [Bacteroidaceae bacterium]
MPYVNMPSAPRRANTYIEYVDVFTADGVVPTAGARNFMYYIDNFDNLNHMEALTEVSGVKLYQLVVLFAIQGEAILEINNEEITIKAGHVIMTMPDSVIRYKNRTTDFKYYMLVCYPKLVNLTFEDLGINFTNAQFSQKHLVGVPTKEQADRCLELYTKMREDMAGPSYEYKSIYQRSLLDALFVDIMAIVNFKSQQEHGDSNSRQYDVYCKFLALLNKHAHEERSVQYYANQLEISSKYLSFVCISYSKKNASTWIDEYVIQKAKVLMTVHGYSFTEITGLLNFQTVSSFSRFFKRVTGMTPKEYARSHR